jgi:hypothetical protein
MPSDGKSSHYLWLGELIIKPGDDLKVLMY